MLYDITFWYEEKYLPTKRHKKVRSRMVEDVYSVEVKEITEQEFPVAFIVHDYKSVYENAKSYGDFNRNSEYKMFSEKMRTYNEKLYIPVRVSHGSAISLVFESLNYIKGQITDYAPYWKGGEEFSEHSIVKSDNKEDVINTIKERASEYIIYDGKIWSECGEPMYNITTFGLGHNHGGTGFFIEYHYNPNISNKNYFNALQREEAIAYGKQVALNRGDTESVEGMGERDIIEVLIPEMVHRNPQKEHGEGDTFLNSMENLISSSDSVVEAGLLAAAFTGISMKG